MSSPAKLAAGKIDPQSPEHPYRQLAAQLRALIERGEITSQLPSTTDLTTETGLAVGTARRAFDMAGVRSADCAIGHHC
jgi:DNA-binding GntR family transcriptional regulator